MDLGNDDKQPGSVGIGEKAVPILTSLMETSLS
jgi:hypothetical protein